ncbi:MAG: hypothetical protein J6T60_04485 [Bacteroidales bacterium]|nr:hypothetical protein [Bacteroidales bacterium]
MKIYNAAPLAQVFKRCSALGYASRGKKAVFGARLRKNPRRKFFKFPSRFLQFAARLDPATT